jgi:AraC-like DNA-binding protein
VAVDALEALLAALERRHADAPLGLHLAADLQPAVFGALGHLLQSCSTFADLLETVVRFNGLLSNIGHTALAFGPGTVEIAWTCAAGGPAFRRHASDYVLGAFAVMARLLLPEQRDLLLAVQLAHPAPVPARLAAQYSDFFRAPVYFDRPQCALVVAADALRQRLPHGDALVRELLERHTLALLRQRTQPPSLPDRVRQLLPALLADGLPDRAAVAAQLGLSERSLHRHLQAEGTSFRALLDEVREALARQRLRADAAPLGEIALGLGFSTPQAFLRWFRARTGTTPGEFRRAAPS